MHNDGKPDYGSSDLLVLLIPFPRGECLPRVQQIAKVRVNTTPGVVVLESTWSKYRNVGSWSSFIFCFFFDQEVVLEVVQLPVLLPRVSQVRSKAVQKINGGRSLPTWRCNGRVHICIKCKNQVVTAIQQSRSSSRNGPNVTDAGSLSSFKLFIFFLNLPF